MYHFYKQVAWENDVEILSFANPDAPPVNGYIADGVIENRIKKSEHILRVKMSFVRRREYQLETLLYLRWQILHPSI